jgi:hypothetical protein
VTQRSEEGPGDVRKREVDEITADDLQRLGRMIGAVPIPAHLMDAVLAQVRAHRAAMNGIDEALVTRERWVEDEAPGAGVGGAEAL